MRINLVTPFAEKDAVKARGARWDAAKTVWYITDLPKSSNSGVRSPNSTIQRCTLKLTTLSAPILCSKWNTARRQCSRRRLSLTAFRTFNAAGNALAKMNRIEVDVGASERLRPSGRK